MFSKWLTEDTWHENLFAEVILKKLCERHLTSLCHANLQCINLRIEIIFSQNLCILMVKTDVKDKFSHFFGCLYGGDAKDSGTSACACGLFSSATTSWLGNGPVIPLKWSSVLIDGHHNNDYSPITAPLPLYQDLWSNSLFKV